MAVALPYVFYAAAAASTYVAVSSARDAKRSAQTIGELNAAAQIQYGEENARAVENQGESQAAIAERQAAASLQQAQAEAAAIRSQNERTKGTQRVSYLKSGVTLSGSAQDVIYDSSIEGELEALNAEYRGKTAYSYNIDQAEYARSQGKTQASLYRSRGRTEAVLSSYEGNSRARAYGYQATGSLLSGIATMANGPKFS